MWLELSEFQEQAWHLFNTRPSLRWLYIGYDASFINAPNAAPHGGPGSEKKKKTKTAPRDQRKMSHQIWAIDNHCLGKQKHLEDPMMSHVCLNPTPPTGSALRVSEPQTSWGGPWCLPPYRSTTPMSTCPRTCTSSPRDPSTFSEGTWTLKTYIRVSPITF